jgi:hypothetical protein
LAALALQPASKLALRSFAQTFALFPKNIRALTVPFNGAGSFLEVTNACFYIAYLLA